MEYLVSARKYRPLTFDTVVGQTALTATLKNAIMTRKLAHAYLFCGPRGVGKTTCARIFARAINCLSPTENGDACGQCESCRSFEEQRSYNIFELDAASNNGVEDIKTLMEQTRIPPQVGTYKVFIIDEVHMLSAAAFNAFLKTLEEPPAHVIFILATTEKHKLLPTIISRCQIYDFERMNVNNTINHLKMVAEKEGYTYEEEALAVIAEKADGGMRDALSIFDQVASFCQGNITYDKAIEDLNVLDSENYFRIIDLSLTNKVPEVMLLLNKVIERGFDPGNLAQGLASHIRNVMMAKDAQTMSLLEVSERQKAMYVEQAKKCPPAFLYRALKLLTDCDINYRQSTNKRLLVELTLIQVAQITQPEEEGASSGRSPKRLKTLFKLIVQQAQSQTAVSQVTATKPAVPVAAQNTDAATTAASTSVTTPTTDNRASVTDATAPAQQAKPSGFPVSPMGRPGMPGLFNTTFNALKNTADDNAEDNADEPAEVVESNEHVFTNEELAIKWMAMCNRMYQNDKLKGISTRMKNLMPEITVFPHVEVVIQNRFLLDEVQSLLKRIQITMCNDLRNKDIVITLRLAEQDEIKPLLTKGEMIAEMRNSNENMEHLFEVFDLETVS